MELTDNFVCIKKMLCVHISGLKARRLGSRDQEVWGYVPLGMLWNLERLRSGCGINILGSYPLLLVDSDLLFEELYQ